jgi:RNA polymerase sigma factor (TIGR02999 family)
MHSAEAGSVTVLMSRFRMGDHEATRKLVELLYPELRRVASGKLRAGHTWQPTALVNELFLELVKIKALRNDGHEGSDEKASFLRFSAFLMNRLLTHHERPLYRQAVKVELADHPDPGIRGTETLHELDDVLERLARVDPKLRTVVELKVFGGLTGDEIAEQMGCSRKTVGVYWTFAKNQLKGLMAPGEKS